jgi:membrane-bound serine protease (ClpP class)
MRKRFWLLSFAVCFAQSIAAAGATKPALQSGDIAVVPLQGEISPSLATFLRRALKAAETAGAGALVLEMNTFGGRLDSAEEISEILNRAAIPTYTFINTNAGSAGALVALATRHIYMAPVSAVGAAAPVLSTGEDLPATMRDKTVSYWSALVRGSAVRNGHNPDVGQAFMDKDKEVKIGERLLHPKGTLLTLNAQEATEKIDGKPLLADGIANSVADLVQKAALKGNVVRLEPTGFEKLAFWITALAPLLLLGGIIGAYLEFKIPGATVPGIIAAVCFTLFFLGHYLAGLSGWEVVALFVVGLLLVLIEILFFAHSTIVFGVVGVFLMLASILWAMVDRYPGENLVPSGHVLLAPLVNLGIAVVAAAIVITLLARYLPHTSFYRRFALVAANPSGPSLSGATRHLPIPLSLAPGAQGRTVSMLRPSGKARFADHLVDVITEGEFVPAETPVTVVLTDGMRVVVKAVS